MESDQDDPLVQSLDESMRGDAPSPFGKLDVTVLGPPVSIQAKRTVRDAYMARVKAELTQYKFILTGPLTLDITWHVSAKSRYETDAKADIDNCIKPIVDAFTGPDGIMVDDCQLKGLYICWHHSLSDEEMLHFQFRG